MIVLSNVARLYDGSSAEETAVQSGVDLFLEGSRIHELRPHDPSLCAGDQLVHIDASAWTVTPGLIDCHSHVTITGIGDANLDATNSPIGL